MPYADLREFIQRLEDEGELLRIHAEVDQDLEIAEITDRTVKSGGPALFFERVRGHDTPVLINLFGSERRMQLALGVNSYEEVAQRIEALIKPDIPETLGQKVGMLGKLRDVMAMPPKIVSRAPCQEVVHEGADARLDRIPIIQCWPGDGGRFITFPVVCTKDPRDGSRNLGAYRLQVYDEHTLAMHWHIHKDAAGHYARASVDHKRLDVAIALGPDPVTMFGATCPLPPGIDETLLIGFLRGEPLELVRCRTVDLEVPATSEIVIEGYVDPDERRIEGPFGDHTGYYSLSDEYPVFHVTCITHRRDPMYPTTIVGKPPMEDFYIGKAIERIFLPLIRMQLPELVDLNMPLAGVFHNCVIVSIRKQFPGHARKVAHGIWGLGQLTFSKLVIVVDEDVNVQDVDEVAWKVLNHIDPGRDCFVVDGPVDVLNHASPSPSLGTKMGVDATRKLKDEGFDRPWPDEIVMSSEIRALVDQRWQEYGFSTKSSQVTQRAVKSTPAVASLVSPSTCSQD